MRPCLPSQHWLQRKEHGSVIAPASLRIPSVAARILGGLRAGRTWQEGSVPICTRLVDVCSEYSNGLALLEQVLKSHCNRNGIVVLCVLLFAWKTRA